MKNSFFIALLGLSLLVQQGRADDTKNVGANVGQEISMSIDPNTTAKPVNSGNNANNPIAIGTTPPSADVPPVQNLVNVKNNVAKPTEGGPNVVAPKAANLKKSSTKRKKRQKTPIKKRITKEMRKKLRNKRKLKTKSRGRKQKKSS